MLSEEDFLFGKTALQLGLLTREQLEECILILQSQREVGLEKTLEMVALENRLIDKEGLLQIYRALGKNRIGSYEILEKIAKGGTSYVYRARHVETGQWAALKVLLPHLASNQEVLSRFLREGKALVQIDHPHIVKGFEIGRHKDSYYIAMELLEGENLSALLKKQVRFEERLALEIGLQIAKALAYLHELGMIHRDVKPQNIMLTKENVVKLIDLGLTKQLTQTSVTQAGLILGTPYYISPEQVLGEGKVTFLSDIYSWGATMYHLLTGRPVFSGSTVQEIMEKHLSEEPRPPSEVVPSLSPETSRLVLRALAKRPEDRFSSFEEVQKEISKVLYPEVKEVVLEENFSKVAKELLSEEPDLSHKKWDFRAVLWRAVEKLWEQVKRTRWDVVFLLLLLGIVSVAGGYLYFLSQQVSWREEDFIHSLQKLQQYSQKGEWKLFQKELVSLHQHWGEKLLDENLEEILTPYHEQVMKKVKKVKENYQGVDSLESLRVPQLVILYDLLANLFKHLSVSEKVKEKKEEFLAEVILLEKRQVEIYKSELVRLLKKRQYKKANDWFDKHLRLLLGEETKKEVEKTRPLVEFFSAILAKVSNTLEYWVQKKGGEVPKFYFLPWQVVEIEIRRWDGWSLDYVIKRKGSFKIRKKDGRVLESPLIFAYQSFKENLEVFLQKLHPLAVIQIMKWHFPKDREAILKFLLYEGEVSIRNDLIRYYLRLIQEKRLSVSSNLLESAEKLLREEEREKFKREYDHLCQLAKEGKFVKLKPALIHFTKKFLSSPFLKEKRFALEGLGAFLKAFEAFQKRRYKKGISLLWPYRKKVQREPFGREFLFFLTFLQVKSSKVERRITLLQQYLEKLLQVFPISSAFLNTLLWEWLYDWTWGRKFRKLSPLPFWGKRKDVQEVFPLVERLCQIELQMGRASLSSLQQFLSEISLKGKQLFLYPPSSRSLLKERLDSLRLLLEFRKAILEHRRKDVSRLFSLLSQRQPQDDPLQVFAPWVRLSKELRGVTFWELPDRIKVRYTFVSPLELKDWICRGWGILDGKFTFVHISRDAFEQHPLSLRPGFYRFFPSLQQIRLTCLPRGNFGLRLQINEKVYLFYNREGKLNYLEDLSLDRFLSFFFDQRGVPPLGKSFFPLGGNPLVIQFHFDQGILRVRQGNREGERAFLEKRLHTFYLWLNLDSFLLSVEFLGRLPGG